MTVRAVGLSRAKLPPEVRNCIALVRAGLKEIESAYLLESEKRGELIAAGCNRIEWAIDYLDHFGVKVRKPRAKASR